MKKLLLFVAALILSASAFAQSPQKINYQAVIRNTVGDPVTSQNVSLRLTVQTGLSGTAIYTEKHTIVTNNFGLVNLQIGAGTPVTNTFASIDWSTGNKFLKIEADITGGSTFTTVATSELVSVPYALSATSSQDNQWTVSSNDITNKNTGNIGIGGAPNASAKLDISATDKGVLIPRITLANRPTSPATGLLIYQTDNTPGFYYYDGSSWAKVAKSSEVAATSSGSIIPFSSGAAVSLTTITGGLSGQTGIIGFGSSAQITPTAGNIDLTGSPGVSVNFAFSAPRSGTLTAISSSFSLSTAMALIGSTVTVSAKLYSANEGSNSFSAVPGAVVTLSPAVTGIVSVGTMTYGTTTGLNVSITAGKRYLIVFSATAAGLTLNNTINGYASAGININ